MTREALRLVEVLWTFFRHGVFGAVYRDVVRDHLTNPHCACDADEEVMRRARRTREALETLGPTFVKLGQFLSRRPDLVPGAYLDELTGLQDRTPVVPFERIRERLEEVCICGRRARAHEPRPSCLHCRGLEARPSAPCAGSSSEPTSYWTTSSTPIPTRETSSSGPTVA